MLTRLKSALVEKGVFAPDLPWQKFSGGRTNHVWKVGDGFVCKLYTPQGNPLFSNSAQSEVEALKTVAPFNLGPRVHSFHQFSFGDVLIYHHVAGMPWCGNVGTVAGVMKALHGLPLSRQAHDAPQEAIDKTSRSIHRALKLPDHKALMDRRPVVGEVRQFPAAFLHGDVVPGNIIEAQDGVRLIDWQSPAWGHPVLDVAIFLSPAMQIANGQAPLTAPQLADFFAVYDVPDVEAAYQVLAPLLHWRMALYCAWRLETGDVTYQQGMRAELEMMDALTC